MTGNDFIQYYAEVQHGKLAHMYDMQV